MDIVCPQCKTEYEFDDGKLAPAGVTVKCAGCSYTFKVRRREVVETAPAGDAAVNAAQDRGAQWMVRRPSGEVFEFEQLTTLQQWIVERRVKRSDEISRQGKKWKPLGEITELEPFFQVVETAEVAEARAKASSRQKEVAAADSATTTPRRAAAKVTIGNPAFATADAQISPVGRRAAWEATGAADDEVDEDVALEQHTGRNALITVLFLLVLLGLGLHLLKPAWFPELWASVKQWAGDGDQAAAKKAAESAYRRGCELFLRDDEQSLREAQQQFAQVGMAHAVSRAARAEVYTSWAQHLRDEAELFDRHAALLVAGRAGKARASRATEAKKLKARTAELRREAKEILKVAALHAAAALEMSPDLPEVQRAVADLRRLQGSRGAAVLDLLAQARATKPDDPETLYVEAVYWAAERQEDRAIDFLDRAIANLRTQQGNTLLRASFQLAILHLRAGRLVKARQTAVGVLAANPDHGWAAELLQQVDREVQATRAPAADGAVGVSDDAGRATTRGVPDAGPTPTAEQQEKPAPTVQPDVSAKPVRPPVKKPRPRTYDQLVREGARASQRGRTVHAIGLFERALKLQPQGVEAISGLAYCDLDLQRYSSAINGFKRALNFAPGDQDAMIGMAEAYKLVGNKKKALDYYRAYLRTHPTGGQTVLARRNVSQLSRDLEQSKQPVAPPADNGTGQPQPAGPQPEEDVPEMEQLQQQ